MNGQEIAKGTKKNPPLFFNHSSVNMHTYIENTPNETSFVLNDKALNYDGAARCNGV